MWSILNPQVVQLLSNLDIIQDVSAAPKIDFNGYPAAHVVPSDAPNEYETNVENERVYAFLVRVFAETKIQTVEQAYLNLLPVVDTVIDAFDQENLKTSGQVIGQDLPDRYTYINVFASPSRFLDYTDAQMIFAEITVKIRVSVDVSS